MTITKAEDLDGLRIIGRIVANTLQAMGSALEPGMTTRELDEIGRDLLEAEGAEPAADGAADKRLAHSAFKLSSSALNMFLNSSSSTAVWADSKAVLTSDSSASPAFMNS